MRAPRQERTKHERRAHRRGGSPLHFSGSDPELDRDHARSPRQAIKRSFLVEVLFDRRQLRLVGLRGDRLLGGLLEVGGRREIRVGDRDRRRRCRRRCGRRRRARRAVLRRRVLGLRLVLLVTRREGERHDRNGGDDGALHFAPPLLSVAAGAAFGDGVFVFGPVFSPVAGFWTLLIHFSWRAFSFSRSFFAFSTVSLSFASVATALMRSRRAVRSA